MSKKNETFLCHLKKAKHKKKRERERRKEKKSKHRTEEESNFPQFPLVIYKNVYFFCC